MTYSKQYVCGSVSAPQKTGYLLLFSFFCDAEINTCVHSAIKRVIVDSLDGESFFCVLWCCFIAEGMQKATTEAFC